MPMEVRRYGAVTCQIMALFPSIPVELHPAGHHAPRFAALPCTERIALAFFHLDPAEFASCLQAADVEGAWRMLSDEAKEAMG